MKQLLTTAAKTGINASKIHKAVAATGEFSGNKIADAVAKSHDKIIMKTKSVEREEILNKLRQVL